MSSAGPQSIICASSLAALEPYSHLRKEVVEVHLTCLLGMYHVGFLDAGDNLQPVAYLICKETSRLGEVGQYAAASGQVEGHDLLPAVKGCPYR